ncbi:MAG TPA: hypothetical protein H9823_12060 [Candidatus Rubneribacter avistercoris]|nr:hypothetical protein [Candidatus Rubneribacter avistercoris]
MKITKNLTYVADPVRLEAAQTADQLKAVFATKQMKGFPAELDIAERTEDHVQMVALDDLLEFAKESGAKAVTYDVTYFPHADADEVTRQVKQLADELEIDQQIIRDLCAGEIEEYLALDAKRDVDLPVHSIVEAYVGGTALAWYGVNDYPRLKRVILRKLASGDKAREEFVERASKAQVDLIADFANVEDHL